MTRIGILSVTCAAMLTIACGREGRDTDMNRPASDTAAVGTAGDRTADAGDRQWLEDRVLAGLTEVRLGEIASQKGQHEDVKAFGRTMVQDHSMAGDELKQIAARHNVMVPSDLDDDHREKANRLSALEPRQFDREYIDTMVDDHEKTLEALEDRLDKEGEDENPLYTPKKADNPFEMELNQWAAKTAPTVRKHLETAKQIDEKLGRMTTAPR
ncbi:MAG: DUF4142 domain-containing protein [Vicinamibacterales bacterium]